MVKHLKGNFMVFSCPQKFSVCMKVFFPAYLHDKAKLYRERSFLLFTLPHQCFPPQKFCHTHKAGIAFPFSHSLWYHIDLIVKVRVNEIVMEVH